MGANKKHRVYLIDLFRGFSTFCKDWSGKIRRHYWKERLKITKIAKFESDTSLASDLQNFTDVCMVGGTNLPLTIQTFVKFLDFKEVYLHKFSTKLITFKLGNFINWKALFWVLSTDFPELVHVKSWKKPWKGLCNSKLFDTVLCPTDSLPTHPDSLQIELVYLLYSTCWGKGLSCKMPPLKKFFHVMSDVESLDS